MFGRLRHWAIAGTVVTGLAMRVLASPGHLALVSGSPGYLPSVGPVSLRFREPTPPPTNLAQLPAPPPEAEPTNPPAPIEVPKTVPPPVVIVPPPDTNPPVPPPIPVSAPAPADPMISPQMLLKYFNRSTNGASGGVIAPMQFAPPTSTTSPSSTATYSTGAPGN